MKPLLFVMICLLIVFPLFSQSSDRRTGQEGGEQTAAPPDYQPYKRGEFPEWLQVVRRAEVIFVGAFPIAILFSSLGYDGYKAVRTAFGGNTVSETSGTEPGEYTPDERRGLLIAGASLSLAVSLFDLFLGIMGRSGVADGE